MLRVFFVLLSLIADYGTVKELAQLAYRLSLVSASIFACTGMLFAIRGRLSNRNSTDLHGWGGLSNRGDGEEDQLVVAAERRESHSSQSFRTIL